MSGRSAGKLIVVGLGGGGSNRFNCIRYASPTDPTGASSAFDLSDGTLVGANYIWVRLLYQPGTLTWSFSGDGVNFTDLASEAATSFFSSGPSHVGFAADGADVTYSTILTVINWKVELLGGLVTRPWAGFRRRYSRR